MQLRLVSAALVLFAGLFVSAPAGAEGLVQLRLTGEIKTLTSTAHQGDDAPDPVRFAAGHLIEVEVGAIVNQVERAISLHIHVANGTTGAELTKLIGSRLMRSGISAETTRASDTAGSVWIDGATYLNVRAGAGVLATVACTEGPPVSVMVLPPSAIPVDGVVTIGASTAIVMKDRAPIRGHSILSCEMKSKTSSAEAATAIWKAATARHWVSTRPGANMWSPTKMSNGAELTGVSVTSRGAGDWRFEVVL